MKTANASRGRAQVYSVGNYLMNGRVLGKGHFARVEEATHRIIGKKVAIKVIDLTCIKEEYARRNLHREPRVMAKLRHPCIAALYETMMHGPRLYVVMEAAGGGDLCALVLAARGGVPGAGARGLPEARARPLAAQLVSAVRHMHAQGVVHRDLKMENIMLDSTKQFIKIVDFGLSNVWSAGGGLRTPCGSLEYAAPELFVDGRRYGPEVDLWSIGVIVYGMVTGGLPFTGGAEGAGAAAGGAGAPGEGRSRPLLRAAIARGFTRRQRAALASVSTECKTFIQHLLEPTVELRMKIEEASRHRWVKRTGLCMRTHPLAGVEPKLNREIYRQISELCGQTVMDVVAQIKADPFGCTAGMYNIKVHLHQMQAPGADLLWSASAQEPRPPTPPEYRNPDAAPPTCSKATSPPPSGVQQQKMFFNSTSQRLRIQNGTASAKPQQTNGSTPTPNGPRLNAPSRQSAALQVTRELTTPQRTTPIPIKAQHQGDPLKQLRTEVVRSGSQALQSPRFSITNRSSNVHGLKKPVYRMLDSGDCGLDRRLPSIEEHSNADLEDGKRNAKSKARAAGLRKVNLEELRLSSCPNRFADAKRAEFYRKAGDGLPSWRSSGIMATPPPRLLLQSNATTIKRASLGNIVSPHSSSNSHCKSERAMPQVGWFSTRNQLAKESTHLQRFRRTAPMK